MGWAAIAETTAALYAEVAGKWGPYPAESGVLVGWSAIAKTTAALSAGVAGK